VIVFDPNVRPSLIPDMAGCVLLTELVRPDVARELVFSGRSVRGVEAVELGLATRACDDPLAEALSMARLIASRSPDAVRAGKRLLNAALPVGVSPVLRAESVEQQALIGGTQQLEAIRAALAGRDPVFR
jgi:enoyl-CoA hydratase/carnithine racemase